MKRSIFTIIIAARAAMQVLHMAKVEILLLGIRREAVQIKNVTEH
jgi:hypothetical protein